MERGKFCLRFVLGVGLDVSLLLQGERGQGDGAERSRSWRLQLGVVQPWLVLGFEGFELW